MPRLAANLTLLFTERPFLERFGAAARAGFRGVECLFPYGHSPSDIRSALRDEGQRLVLFNAPPGDWAQGERGLAGVPGREADFRDAFRLALEYARALECPRVHVMHGVPGEDVEPGEARAVFVANLRWAGALAGEHGITLLTEPLNPWDVPGYPITHPGQAIAVCEAVGRRNVRMQLDLYHCQRVQGDLADTLARSLPWVGHIQIAGVPGRQEPDRGEINYRFLLERLDGLGYGGWVGCEYHPAGRTEDGLGWAAPWGIRG